MFRLTTLATISSLIASLAIPATAHTWIEEYQNIGPNGSYIGDHGYSRGYIARTDPTFDGSFNSLWLLPQADATMPNGDVRLRINSSDPLCHPSQRTSNYTDPRYPKLKTSPGAFVAAKYFENGHVTLPWNQPGKPPEGGTVLVFGTTTPSPEEKIVDVMKWTTDGKGGNGNGRLISTQNFDDGRCHQINECYLSVERQAAFPNKIPQQDVSIEQWCETDFKVPGDLKSGDKLTTYWVWQWPTEAGNDCIFPDGKDEYYTTCADFDIEEGGQAGMVKIADEPVKHTLLQENYQTDAVPTYTARTAHNTLPVVLDNWNNRMARPENTANSSWLNHCTSSLMAGQSAAAAAGFPASIPPLCPSGKYATGTLSAYYASKGIESAKSAAAAQQASATAAAVTSAPAATNSHHAKPHPAANNSPTVSIVTVTSTLTTLYKETVTLVSSANVAPQAESSNPQLPTISTVNSYGAASTSAQAASSESDLPTVSTVASSPAPLSAQAATYSTFPAALSVSSPAAGGCNNESPASAQAVQVPTSSAAMAQEHVAKHRAHARHFGA